MYSHSELVYDAVRRVVDPAIVEPVTEALLGNAQHEVTVIDGSNPFNQGYQRALVLGVIGEGKVSLPSDPPALVVTKRSPSRADGVIRVEYDSDDRLDQEGWLGREDCVATEEVAKFFRNRCAGLPEQEEAKYPASYAPAATDSFAPVTIGGDLPEVVAESDDPEWPENLYEWFDLAAVPVGGSVYRLSSTGTLWVFTRREEGWEVSIEAEADYPEDMGAFLAGALHVYDKISPAESAEI